MESRQESFQLKWLFNSNFFSINLAQQDLGLYTQQEHHNYKHQNRTHLGHKLYFCDGVYCITFKLSPWNVPDS